MSSPRLHVAPAPGPRSSHTLDPNAPLGSVNALSERVGKDATELVRVAMAGSTAQERALISRGKVTWAGFFELVARGLFGKEIGEPKRYEAFQTSMRVSGLADEFEALMDTLPRSLLNRLRAHGMTPRELFAARAAAVTSWQHSGRPINTKELQRELAADSSRTLASDAAAWPAEIAVAIKEQQPARAIAQRIEAIRRRDVDVHIIGAGAAGQSAANALLDMGYSVALTEAKDHAGGRASTDRQLLGVPVDKGCAWLHESTVNQLLPVIEALGFETVGTEKFQKVFAGGDPVEDAKDVTKRLRDTERGWADVAKKNPSIPVSMLAVPDDRIDKISHAVLGPLEAGLELNQFSIGGFGELVTEHNDRMVSGGLGNAVGAFAHGLPVELNARVSEVKWDAAQEKFEIRAGDQVYRARKVIVTLPPPVITQGLTFDPPLPAKKAEAIASFQMSLFEKVALKFAPGSLQHVQPFERACGIDKQGRAFEMALRPFGDDVAIVLAGASAAVELLALSDQEAERYALDLVATHYGQTLRAGVIASCRTRWSEDPTAMGSYGVTIPSASPETRAIYAAPTDDRIFWAGEATAQARAGTVEAAFVTGRAAGEQAAEALRRERVGGVRTTQAS